MSFTAPLWLLALAVVPAALAAADLARRRVRRFAVRFTAVPTLRLAAGAACGRGDLHRTSSACSLVSSRAVGDKRG